MRLMAWIMSVLIASSAWAQDDSAALRAWTRSMVERLLVSPAPQGTLTRYTVSMPASATQAQVEQWRREIQGKPDHPRRGDYETQSRRLAQGPDIMTGRLAWWDRDTARLGTESPWMDQKRSYVDTGVLGGVDRWVKTPVSLIAADPQTPHPANIDYGYDKIVRSAAETLAGLASGGLVGVSIDPETIEARRDGDGYVLSGRHASGKLRFEARAKWHGDRAEITRVTIRRTENDRVYRSLAASGWRELVGWGWCATTLTRTDEDGSVQSISIQDVEPIDRPSVELLAAVPRVGDADPWRGAWKPERVDDFRSSSPTRTTIAQDGSELVRPVVFDLNRSPLRWAGWVSGAAASSLVAGIWYYRRRHGGSATRS